MSEPAAEKRVLVTSGSDPTAKLLKLPNPKTGSGSTYILRGTTLQEVSRFKQKYTSWFAGDYVIEDGSVYLATQVDALLVLLPILDKCRGKTTEKPDGLFCSFEDVLSTSQDAYPTLALLADKVSPEELSLICQTKVVGSEVFVRLEDKRVVAWLAVKVEKIAAHLKTLPGSEYAALGVQALRTYCVGLLSEYLDSHWAERLSALYRIKEAPAAQGGPCAASAPAGAGSRWVTAGVLGAEDDVHKARAPAASAAKPGLTDQQRKDLKRKQDAKEAKEAKLAKEARGMHKLSMFFKKPS